MEENQQQFNQRLNQQISDPDNLSAEKTINQYNGSDLQLQTYEALQNSDKLYQKFINRVYGSYENFIKMNRINDEVAIFDPTEDYHLDVSIVKKDSMFKSDHFSAQEVILESLSGVCTVWFVAKDGSTRRITGTLKPSFMPTKELRTRVSFFSPLPNDRIGIWDLNEQGWKSFYMSNVFKFVRDDTNSYE
jgi:hypothetical protein